MNNKARRRIQDREWTMGLDISNGRDRTAFVVGCWEDGVFRVAASGSFEGEGGFDLSLVGLPLKVLFSAPINPAGGENPVSGAHRPLAGDGARSAVRRSPGRKRVS